MLSSVVFYWEFFDCCDLEKDVKFFFDEMIEIGWIVCGQMVVDGEWVGDIWCVVVDGVGVCKELVCFLWFDGIEVQFG